MSRRSRSEEAPFSLDSLLDIVTNVVGVLVLVAMVTVLSAGNISVPSGVTAASSPRSGQRVLFECSGDKIFLLDEAENQRRVLDAVNRDDAKNLSGNALADLLNTSDTGDANHRVRAASATDKLTWVYWLRPEARGEQAADLDGATSAFQKQLAALKNGDGFVYFVVHADSFEVFRRARELARAQGIPVGWHPAEVGEPVRLSAHGSLGRRVQ